MHGIVRSIKADGNIVEAQWLEGVKHGLCRSILPSGSHFIQYFKAGKKHGMEEMRNASNELVYRAYYDEGVQINVEENPTDEI